MDYKQLSLVCELMGGKLGFSQFNGEYEYEFLGFSIIAKNEHDGIHKVQKHLALYYPINYANALNQLNIK